MTSTALALRSVCLLAWISFLPSNLGFQLPNVSLLPPATQGVVTRRQSPFLLTNQQRSTRGLPLAGIFGKHDFSSSSSKDSEENNADDKEQAKEPTEDEDADAVATSSSSSSSETADASPVDIVATDSTDVVVATNSSATTSSDKSLWVLINEIGNSFKDMGQRATTKGSESDAQSKKILYAVKACVCYTLFILYRAYRGVFVLLPATFLTVYRKMEAVYNSGNLSLDEIGYAESGEDAVVKTTKWRTRFTVSILTTVITLSYIVSGILKMGSKFLRTIAKTSDVPKSFEAAADEAMDFEGRISRVGKINGEEDDIKTSGLLP